MLEAVEAIVTRAVRGLRDLDPIAAWADATDNAVREEAFQRDPEFLARLLPLMRILTRWFDTEVHGMEHVPSAGPVLLVGNHSGGFLTPDTSAMFVAWYDAFGLERPLIGLAFDAAFGIPGFRTLMRSIGEVPANSRNAARALAAGAGVLVYPGGDRECFRPWTDRNRIEFSGRSGFVSLALRAQVPVVPVVSHGTHDSILILTRGEWIGPLLGSERIRTQVFPVALQIPWGVSPVWLPGLPLPAKISIDVLPPMPWSHLGPEAADDPAILRRCYDEITGLMQDRLSAMAAERPWPVLSRLTDLLPAGLRNDGARA